MLTNALLTKISLGLAAVLTLLGIWYAEYHSNAAKEAAFFDQIEKAQKAHRPTKAQLDEAGRQPPLLSGYEQFLRHGLDGLNGSEAAKQ